MVYYIETPDGFVAWAGEPINGVRRTLSILRKSSPLQLRSLGLYLPEPANMPPAGQRIVSTSVARVDGVVRFVHQMEAIPLEDRKAERLTELAQRRWEIETGGVTVGELTVPSDRDTQDRIDQIVKAYDDGDLSGPVKFKLAPGVHIDIDETTLRAIKAVGAQHIQECFAREADLAAAILAAEDLPALEAIDIAGFWP